MITAGVDCGAKNVKVVILNDGKIAGRAMVPAGIDAASAAEKPETRRHPWRRVLWLTGVDTSPRSATSQASRSRPPSLRVGRIELRDPGARCMTFEAAFFVASGPCA